MPIEGSREIICGLEAIANAANVFREDVGRYPTRAEAQAGLVLADTQAALFTYLERVIQVGNRVLWAEYDDNGKFLQQTRDGHDDALVFAGHRHCPTRRLA